MKSVCTGLMVLCGILSTMAQEDSFEKRLKLEVLDQSTIERWDFGATSISCLSDGLWEHVLPKSTQGTDKIILNRNELNYFMELDGIKIKTKTGPISKPEHWENRFGKQVQTLTLSKSLTFLAIKGGKLEQFSIDTLVGVQYATYYPHGELDVPDKHGVPIIFQQENEFDEHSPVLLVSSTFMNHIDLNEAKVHRETVVSGSEDMSGTRYCIGLDFNGDGQLEVLMYNETIHDHLSDEGDESLVSESSIIGLYYKNQWYRTSIWEIGMDGLEGF
ncbi:hypothetical protein [Flagellimonas iocasae]|uniref:VCBS repeat-containing protein n=1 Tax=Flagellimonas iocasae TaxID=2055905 RepID=A0ABW4XX38_9FLAO